jgi:hypothetical protein
LYVVSAHKTKDDARQSQATAYREFFNKFLEQGYEPVSIQADIAEGKKFFNPNAKRLFYYDDFLGQFFLGDRAEYFGRNQDMAIVAFMEMVRNSAHSRLILTTREHLLQSARMLSERLARSAVIDHRCILELRDYTYAHKARILYNHLYFSGLPQAYKNVVLADDFFLEIIGHEHFNPRLIEWLSTQLREREVPAHEYRTYISRLLQSPHDIWLHAFRNQISNAARDLLFSFYTLGEYTEIVDLEPVFYAFYRLRAKKYNQATNPGDFRKALHELDGAFLSYRSGNASYLNPSIREFVASVISGEPETADDLVVSSVRFRQIVNLWRLAKANSESDLAKYLSRVPLSLITALSRLLYAPSTRWDKLPNGIHGFPIDVGDEGKIDFLLELAEYSQSKEVFELAKQSAEQLISHWNRYIPDFSAARKLLQKIAAQEWLLERGGRAYYRKVLDGLLEYARYASAEDWLELLALPDEALDWTASDQSNLVSEFDGYRESGVADDRHNCSTVDEMNNLIGSLSALGERTGIDFSYDIQLLSEDVAEREEERPALTGGDHVPSGPLPQVSEPVVTDDDVRQMFSTLKDE